MNRRVFLGETGAATVVPMLAAAAADPSTLPSEMLEAMLALYRRSLRGSFEVWCEHALLPIRQKPALHHKLVASALQDVAEGRCDRLMLLLPPGSAETTYASDLYPPWRARVGQPTPAATTGAGLRVVQDRQHRDCGSTTTEWADGPGMKPRGNPRHTHPRPGTRRPGPVPSRRRPTWAT
jgi:hypothetical protein